MTKRGDIALGDEVKDTITGLTGVVVAITDWLNGCQRIQVQPRELKDGKPVETSGFDVEQVELVTPAQPVAKVNTGGPHDAPTRQPDARAYGV